MLEELIKWQLLHFPQETSYLLVDLCCPSVDFHLGRGAFGILVYLFKEEFKLSCRRLGLKLYLVESSMREGGEIVTLVSPVNTQTPLSLSLNPKSFSPTLGGLGGATHPQQTQGCCHLPGSPRSPRYPCPGSDGRTVRDPSLIPRPTPSFPVINSQNNFQNSLSPIPLNGSRGAQDGGGHMAWPFPWVSPSQNPSLPAFPNPFLPAPPLLPKTPPPGVATIPP